MEEENNDFIVEEIDRYKLHYDSGTKQLTYTGNNIEAMVKVYEDIIKEYVDNKAIYRMIVYIYDYDKETNIYYYNSEDEQ